MSEKSYSKRTLLHRHEVSLQARAGKGQWEQREDGYEQLSVEGYLISKEKRGYYATQVEAIADDGTLASKKRKVN